MGRNNSNNKKNSAKSYCSVSSWTSPEDLLGILVLLIAFPFVALDLVRTGGWRGCALSVAWCVTYQDPKDQTDGLPQGTWTSRIIVIWGTTIALILRFQSIRARMVSPYQILLRQDERSTTITTRLRIGIGSLLLSNVAMLSCAVIPMSCGCLHDGKDWVYVSWRDYIHDGSLWTIYISTIVSGFAAGYHRRYHANNNNNNNNNHKTKRLLFYLTILFAVFQSVGIYRCPTSSEYERLILLFLEVVALALTQFLHYGTISRLFLLLNGSSITGSHLLSPISLSEVSDLHLHLLPNRTRQKEDEEKMVV